MALGEPSAVIAEGVHQEIGRCHVHDVDLSNYTRYRYLCPRDFDEDFTFGCVPQKLPPRRPSWYTVCGKAHTDQQLYLGVVVALSVAASSVLGLLLLPPPRLNRAAKAKKP